MTKPVAGEVKRSPKLQFSQLTKVLLAFQKIGPEMQMARASNEEVANRLRIEAGIDMDIPHRTIVRLKRDLGIEWKPIRKDSGNRLSNKSRRKGRYDVTDQMRVVVRAVRRIYDEFKLDIGPGMKNLLGQIEKQEAVENGLLAGKPVIPVDALLPSNK